MRQAKHGFEKPNDLRVLQLMDHAAKEVMEAYPDTVLAFGESDEYRYAYMHPFSRYGSPLLASGQKILVISNAIPTLSEF